MKRFKYFFMSLVLVTGLFGSGFSIVDASSYATGKAVIPAYYTDSSAHAYFYISNITDNPINITITFYNEDGTLLTDDNNSSTGRITGSSVLNYCDQNLDSSATFSINAHSTGLIILASTSTPHHGYGVIQWAQSSNELYGLVALGVNKFYRTGTESRNNIDINNGLPF